MKPITLATTHHDPEGRLYEQTARVLPVLQQLFERLLIHLTSTSQERSANYLRDQGIELSFDSEPPGGLAHIGAPRRLVIGRALESGAEHLVFCDFDRILHWAEFYPEELAQALEWSSQRDFSLFGRTPRAYATHPRCQRDTEATINTVFAAVSGHNWDIGSGARGMSRRAAETLLLHTDDQSVGVDVTWPLFLLRDGSFQVDHLFTEGMEFETTDRYADQVAELGSVDAWLARLDNDPRQWVLRLELARVEVEAIARFA